MGLGERANLSNCLDKHQLLGLKAEKAKTGNNRRIQYTSKVDGNGNTQNATERRKEHAIPANHVVNPRYNPHRFRAPKPTRYHCQGTLLVGGHDVNHLGEFPPKLPPELSDGIFPAAGT
jgi:hypothetical protein